MTPQPERKALRLPSYDYSQPGVYFVTICTDGRRMRFGTVPVGAIHESPEARVALSAEGECVRQIVEELPVRYSQVQIANYVIMPNHVHLLICIGKEEGAIHESPLHTEGKRALLGKVIGYLKMNAAKRIHNIHPGETIWQRSYYEHIVRNEEEYLEIWQYIDGNPDKWVEDRYYAPS